MTSKREVIPADQIRGITFQVVDNPGITDEPKAVRGLRSDWLATEHVLQTYCGSKHSGFVATLYSQLQT